MISASNSLFAGGANDQPLGAANDVKERQDLALVTDDDAGAVIEREHVLELSAKMNRRPGKHMGTVAATPAPTNRQRFLSVLVLVSMDRHHRRLGLGDRVGKHLLDRSHDCGGLRIGRVRRRILRRDPSQKHARRQD